MNQAPYLFEEKQRFTQIWIWLILLGVNGLFIFAFFYQIIGGKPFGDKPMSDMGLEISVLLSFAFSVVFYLLRLDTRINSEAIYIRFYPFQLKFKKIKWENVAKAYVRKYKPISEYGGWGLRLGAYNIKGNIGLQLEMKDGSKLLIGTNQGEQLEKVLLMLQKN